MTASSCNATIQPIMSNPEAPGRSSAAERLATEIFSINSRNRTVRLSRFFRNLGRGEGPFAESVQGKPTVTIARDNSITALYPLCERKGSVIRLRIEDILSVGKDKVILLKGTLDEVRWAELNAERRGGPKAKASKTLNGMFTLDRLLVAMDEIFCPKKNLVVIHTTANTPANSTV